MFIFKITLCVLSLIIFIITPSKCQSGRGIGGMGGRRTGQAAGGRGAGAHGGRSVTPGIQNKGLPPGYANIRGEVMDMTNKLIQRVTSAGTNYFSFDNQNGAPVFKRREVDSGRRFVLFPDINFPPGDGHYIVLRKMPGVNIPGLIPQALYEAFQLALGDSIHGFVTEFNSQQYLGGGSGHSFPGISSATGGSGFRIKRKSLSDDEPKVSDVLDSGNGAKIGVDGF